MLLFLLPFIICANDLDSSSQMNWTGWKCSFKPQEQGETLGKLCRAPVLRRIKKWLLVQSYIELCNITEKCWHEVLMVHYTDRTTALILTFTFCCLRKQWWKVLKAIKGNFVLAVSNWVIMAERFDEQKPRNNDRGAILCAACFSYFDLKRRKVK